MAPRTEADARALLPDPDFDEVIVVDAASADGTAALARAAGATVVTSRAGRAAQLNASARLAAGEVVLFLHADVRLPPGAAALVPRALDDDRVVASAFKTWHHADGGPNRLGPLLHLADVRSRYTRLPYGDQAIFVRRGVFDAVGGYPDQLLMEDLEFSRRLARQGGIARVRARVQVSGRRFLARPIFYTLAVNVFRTDTPTAHEDAPPLRSLRLSPPSARSGCSAPARPGCHWPAGRAGPTRHHGLGRPSPQGLGHRRAPLPPLSRSDAHHRRHPGPRRCSLPSSPPSTTLRAAPGPRRPHPEVLLPRDSVFCYPIAAHTLIRSSDGRWTLAPGRAYELHIGPAAAPHAPASSARPPACPFRRRSRVAESSLGRLTLGEILSQKRLVFLHTGAPRATWTAT